MAPTSPPSSSTRNCDCLSEPRSCLQQRVLELFACVHLSGSHATHGEAFSTPTNRRDIFYSYGGRLHCLWASRAMEFIVRASSHIGSIISGEAARRSVFIASQIMSGLEKPAREGIRSRRQFSKKQGFTMLRTGLEPAHPFGH